MVLTGSSKADCNDPDAAFLNAPLVVEIGSRVGVSATGSLLAQLGADVIVVEPHSPIDKDKWQNRPVAMAGKRSVILDPDRNASELTSLLEQADIILLSTDVDPDQLSIWNGETGEQIVCDLTAFGHSGPMAGLPMSEGLVEAISGVVDTTGLPDEVPSILGTPLLDMHGAVYAAGAIVAALRSQRLHGGGDRIEVALFDIGSSSLINYLPFFLLGKETSRSGNRHPLYGPWGTFDAIDGTFLMCAVTDQHWKEICGAMDRPELVCDLRFADSSARLANFASMDAEVQGWVGKNTLANCEKTFVKIGIPCGRIVTVDGLADDPNVVQRRSVVPLRDPISNKEFLLARSPFHAEPLSGRSPASIPAPNADRQYLERLGRRSRPKSSIRALTKPLPFDGVRVVEIGQYTVAPLASRIMGALGADVIKVESPQGDALRNATPLREDGAAYIFAISNTDKRGVVLDLRAEADREILHRILAKSDVLLENLKPGSLAKLGFDSATLRSCYPSLIYCSISGFGVNSAYPGRPALDTVIQAMSGLMDITRPNGEATKAGISASDNFGGQFGFLAIGSALELRDRTGIASHIDLSMQEVTLWATQLEWNSQHSVRPRIITVADGHVAIDGSDAEIRAGLKLGNADLDHTLATRTREDVIASLPQKLRGQPVFTAKEVFEHPQSKARGLLVECPTVEGDRWVVFSQPFRLLSTPTPVSRVLGRLGGTNDQILAEFGPKKPLPHMIKFSV